MWGWLWLSNSASHSPRIVRQIAFGTQQNAFLWVAFGTQQNALYGSRLELSRTLSPMFLVSSPPVIFFT
ncbi:hypothetical protein LEP1GSC019_2788 [Leptospira interrogans serovar Pyrogenes str. 2006006960]|nr:hypothetical protein LEP1GSC019_2788 [Leptospira interrogans serovar Pyrogenes str. 2006006960]